MVNNEPIRLNLKVHPDKDPALYQLLINIAKEARTRRVMNLAYAGLIVEQNGIVGEPLLRQTATSNNSSSSLTSVIDEAIINPSSSNEELQPPYMDEEELEAIGGMFQ